MLSISRVVVFPYFSVDLYVRLLPMSSLFLPSSLFMMMIMMIALCEPHKRNQVG